MPKLKLRANAGVVVAMLLGAFLSAVPSQGGHVRQGARRRKRAHRATSVSPRRARSGSRNCAGGYKLQPRRKSLWNNVAQIMRDNAATFRANVPDRSTGPDTSTAVDDLKAFQIIADEHANGLRKLIPAFEALYAEHDAGPKETRGPGVSQA